MATTPITKRFRPFAVGTEDNWVVVGSGSKVAAVDPGHPINHDDYARWIKHPQSSTQKQSFKIDRNFAESMGTINELRVHVRADPWFGGADIKLSVALGDPPTWVTSAGIDLGGADWIDKSVALARPGGGSWTENDLRDTTFQFAVENASAGVPDYSGVTSLWPEVDYLPTDESAGAIPPEFPSRKLRRSRLPVAVMSAELRGDALDIDLLEDFEVVHSEGPHYQSVSGVRGQTKGWGDKDWQARRFRCIKSDLDEQRMTVQMRAIDLYDYACMFWHTGISPYTAESAEQYPDGPAILHPGSTETFSRASKAWIADATPRGVELPNNKKRVGPDGILIEGAAENSVVNSAFFNGWTGWTQFVAGQMSLDTSELFWDDEVPDGYGGTNQTAKLTTVGGTACAVQRAIASAAPASKSLALSIWHQDEDAAAPPRVRIYNNTTTKYYNAGTEGWQAGSVDNPLNGRTTWGRSSIVLANDTSPDALTIRVSSPASNKYTHITNVQVEHNPDGQQNSTSPIPTYDAAVSRSVDQWKWSTNVGRRIWPVEAGTLVIRCKFFYDGPIGIKTPGSGNKAGVPIALLYYDTNNWAYLTYDTENEELAFIISAGGVEKRTDIPFTPTENQTYRFAGRWTSTRGELDLPTRTISVWKDDVRGANEAQHTADITEADTGTFNLGIGETGFGGNSVIAEPGIAFSHVEVLPWPLTVEELKARP